MVYEAELVGLVLGLHLIKTEQAGRTSFAMVADNQAAVKVVSTELTHPGQHIAADFLNTATLIENKRRSPKYSLTLRWTAGHTTTQGNEEMDKEAKRAADLPHLEKSPALISPIPW
jgi:ribonuclease HI